MQRGHVPQAEDLRRYYKEQLAQAEKTWSKMVSAKGKDGKDEAKKGE